MKGDLWEKNMRRVVGEKIKICEVGSAKFSIPPPIRISNGIALR